MFKVHYPPYFLPDNYRRSYYDFLLRGFQSFDNVEVVFDKDLVKKCKADNGDHFTAIVIDFNGRSVPVYYDWSDFQWRMSREYCTPDALYYKVECGDFHRMKFGMRPIGQGVTDVDEYFDLLPELREIKDSHVYLDDVFARLRATSGAPGYLSERITALDLISQKHIDSDLGIVEMSNRPSAPPHLRREKKLPYDEYLKRSAKSKLNILLPGMGELTWRVTELMGIGCACIMPEISTVLPGNTAGCFIQCRRDYSDLQDQVKYYLEHDNAREAIARNARRYYDKWLSPRAQARHILRDISIPNMNSFKCKYAYPTKKPNAPAIVKGWNSCWIKQFLNLLDPAKKSVIVEVGVWYGKTSKLLLKNFPNATLISVDTFAGGVEHQPGMSAHEPELAQLYDVYRVNTWDDRERVVPLRMMSWQGLYEIWKHNVKPDLIYIDASHEYADVKLDLETAYKLFPYAAICGDNLPIKGVKKAVDEFELESGVKINRDGRFWSLEKKE